MPVVVANIHEVGGQTFLVAFLYKKGYVAANLIKPFNGSGLGEELRKLVYASCEDMPPFSVWTSTDAVYLACMREADITGQYKPQDETSETLRAIDEVHDALIEIYDLQQEEAIEPKQLSKWKQRIVSFLQKLIRRLEGENTL